MAHCPPRSALISPRESLAACVRAFVMRNTIGSALPPHQRLNHFPASPACTVTWFIEGRTEWVHGGMPPGRIIFCGPKTGPVTSVNQPEVHSVTMLVMPDALHALTGIEAAAHVDRSSAACDVFDAQWLAMLTAALDGDDDTARIRTIEDFIEPRWHAAQHDGSWDTADSYRAWAEAMGLRAALSGAGRSVRQTDRRIRAAAGQPMGRLLGVGRSEQALMNARDTRENGRVKWAEVAVAAGYADQAHLCREARRVTGSSPQRLLRLVDDDEGHWVYRLWR